MHDYLFYVATFPKMFLCVVVSLPNKDPSGASTIIECNEFDRIKEAARIVTAEEKAAAAEKVKQEKEQIAVEKSHIDY